jgi:short-subunit dehydrogenase
MTTHQKTIVITGGSRGIGKAIIKQFAEAGFHIITCGRTKEDLKKMEEDIYLSFPNATISYQVADLSKRDQVNSFIKFILSQIDTIDILINNAGLFIPGQISTETEEVLESMIHTNLYSAYHLTRGLLDIMKKKKAGHIFNICSTASITPYINGGSYCISKFALYGMTKVLREEMKTFGIKVTAVLPGATLTSSWDGVDLPSERFMMPKDVAQSIYQTYLLSNHTVVEELILRPQLGDI